MFHYFPPTPATSSFKRKLILEFAWNIIYHDSNSQKTKNGNMYYSKINILRKICNNSITKNGAMFVLLMHAIEAFKSYYIDVLLRVTTP